MSSNPNAQELLDIADIASALSELMDGLIERGSTIQPGNVRLYDVNGEEIGWLASDDEYSAKGNWYVYRAEDDYE